MTFFALYRLLSVVALAVLAGSCTVAVEQGPLPQPQYCTREYAPVCAVRGGDRQTFANGCRARQAGYRVVRRGECHGQFEGGRKPVMCTMEYRPVCARRGNKLRTFANACGARAENFRIVGNGAC